MAGEASPLPLSAHPAVPDDLAALAVHGPQVVTAARAALDDLAHGRVTGKLLRLVYGDIDPKTRAVLAIGVRDEHAIYRLAVARMQANEEPAASLPRNPAQVTDSRSAHGAPSTPAKANRAQPPGRPGGQIRPNGVR